MTDDFVVFMPLAKEAWEDKPIRPIIRSMAMKRAPEGYALVKEETADGTDYDPETGEPYATFAVRFLFRRIEA